MRHYNWCRKKGEMMRGREEHELRANEKMETMIEEYPKYLQDYYASMGTKSYTTRKNYVLHVLHMLKRVKGTDKVSLEELRMITTGDLQRYMNSLQYRTLKDGTQKKNGESIKATRWSSLNHFYSFLTLYRYIDRNPFSDYIERATVKESDDVIFLTEDEIQQLLEHISATAPPMLRNRDLAIIALAISTGLRETSVTEINISDINFANGSIFTTNKGDRSWHVYPADMAMDYIKAWLKDREKLLEGWNIATDALFISLHRRRMSANSLVAMMKRYGGIFENKNITFHKLRSTCATNLYKASEDLYLVAETLGHKDTRVTKRYTKLGDERRRQAGSFMNDILRKEEVGE